MKNMNSIYILAVFMIAITNLWLAESIFIDEVSVPKKEKGRLSGLGRDTVKVGIIDPAGIIGGKISSGISKISEKIGLKSKGLDTDRSFISEGIDAFKNRIKAVHPGTRWCGGGSTTTNVEELGLFKGTDACCRDHDHCEENILADETKYGLHNSGLFTRSHCKCDTQFYDCLKNASSIISYEIGFTYFTVLGPQCFKEDYPIIKCLEYSEDEQQERKKCLLYELDKTLTPVFQWFDSPTFISPALRI